MESLKRFYMNLIAGFTILNHKELAIEQQEDDMKASNRVSRDVDHYRTHFFNL